MPEKKYLDAGVIENSYEIIFDNMGGVEVKDKKGKHLSYFLDERINGITDLFLKLRDTDERIVGVINLLGSFYASKSIEEFVERRKNV